jgi:hypothetical protein
MASKITAASACRDTFTLIAFDYAMVISSKERVLSYITVHMFIFKIMSVLNLPASYPSEGLPGEYIVNCSEQTDLLTPDVQRFISGAEACVS